MGDKFVLKNGPFLAGLGDSCMEVWLFDTLKEAAETTQFRRWDMHIPMVLISPARHAKLLEVEQAEKIQHDKHKEAVAQLAKLILSMQADLNREYEELNNGR